MSALFNADSVVVATARELLGIHLPQSADDPTCAVCGQLSPCGPAANARQIELATDFTGRLVGA
ncbi:hypothetical protein [Catellatospora sp. NPDC049609]|uniref:hypothetical protein n=1 Tax=Catellatospora sp. NPDC049609 TaxID=3155505 RepID=UPI00341979FC